MKTIYVKDVFRRIPHMNGVRWRQVVPTFLFLGAMFLLGRAAGEIMGELSQTTGATVLESENWGLGFGQEGQKPSGNASAAELQKYDAYFCAQGDEKVIVKRMVEDGHTVGNHTYHHPDMSQISDKTSFRKEMDDTASLFVETTGTDMAMYYRPPQGKYSTTNLQMAKELGYSTFFWSLAYVDWNQDSQPSHDEAFDKLTKRIHPGAIVLLHSTSKTNGEIMDELLTKWEEMGYTFRPLSDFTEGSGNGTAGVL